MSSNKQDMYLPSSQSCLTTQPSDPFVLLPGASNQNGFQTVSNVSQDHNTDDCCECCSGCGEFCSGCVEGCFMVPEFFCDCCMLFLCCANFQ